MKGGDDSYPTAIPGIAGGGGNVHVGSCDGSIRQHLRRSQAEDGHSQGVTQLRTPFHDNLSSHCGVASEQCFVTYHAWRIELAMLGDLRVMSYDASAGVAHHFPEALGVRSSRSRLLYT